MPVDSLVKANLGCGANIIPDWINIDAFFVPKEENKDFLKGDITKELPLASDSVDYVLCDQVLEHIKMSEVPIALYNIKRILKVGGKAVIIVPDFEGAVKQWLAVNQDNNAFNPFIFQFVSEVIYGNQRHEGEFHRTPMSAGFLHYVLCMVGLNKHELSIYPANGVPPKFPGIVWTPEAVLRNPQLVAEITKE